MREKWLNFLLFLSSKIYKLKQRNLSAGPIRTFITFIQIIFLEIVNAIVSLPSYFFIVPSDIEQFFRKNHKDVKVYRLRRKITLFMVALFLLFEVVKFSVELYVITSLPQQTQAFNYSMMTSGTYVGNETDDRPITGIGFQPDVVIVQKSNSPGATVIRTSTMAVNTSKVMTGTSAFAGNLIKTLESNGFTIGTDTLVNQSGATYQWIAFKGAEGQLKLGTYTGNGTSQTISGVGFSPDYVIVMSPVANQVIHKSSSMPVSTAYFFDGDTGNTNRITALTSDGFSVGNSGTANTASTTYHYIAWNEIAGKMDVGTYTGDGTTGRDIGPLGFQPGYVIVSPDSSSLVESHRPTSLIGDQTMLFIGTTLSNLILSLDADSFKVGSHNAVNQNGLTYYYAAFVGSIPPTLTQSGYRVYENADDTDVGSALGAQDSGVTLSAAEASFRVRMLLHVGTDQLPQNGENFKLQYVDKGSGTCAAPSDGTPAVYTDVTTSTFLAYHDNAAPADGAPLTANANDPVHSGHTTVPQTYEESNTFTNAQAAIPAGQEGLWDISLYDNGAPAGTTYCLRVVKSDGTELTEYSVYPEVTIASGDTTGPSVTNVTSTSADGTYGIGAQILLTVTFDEAVTVTGTPELTLETGDTDGVAVYTSGSGTDTLTFTYTVGTGENATDLDYAGINALVGTITDSLGNAATLTLSEPGQTGSLGANKNIEINTDVTGPTIVNVTSTKEDGTYGTNEAIPIQIEFDEPVVVTVGGAGTPVLTLETGDTDRVAVYTSGSGTDTLTFTYTVVEGDMSSDLDYTGSDALNLDGGSIQDTRSNAATLTLPEPGQPGSLGANKALVIDTTPPDTTAPEIMNVTSSTADGAYGAGAVISIQVEFSEVVTIGGSPELSLNTGGTAVYSGGVGSIHTFSYTVGDGENTDELDYSGVGAFVSNEAIIRDDAGNDADVTLPSPGDDGSLGANKTLIIDTIKPTIETVTASDADGEYREGDELTIEVKFSEAVTVTGSLWLTLETGAIDAVAGYTSGSGTDTLIFTYTVVEGEQSDDLDYLDTNALAFDDATIRDSAGNGADITLPSPGQAGSLGANKQLVIDTVAPSAVTLTLSEPTATSLKVSWLAPGDNGSTGTATAYDLRYALTPITDDASFDAATPVSNEPVPQIAGSEETFVLSGLTPETTYYVALKTSDSAEHISALSNIPSLQTLAAPEEPEEPPQESRQASGYSSPSDILDPADVIIPPRDPQQTQKPDEENTETSPTEDENTATSSTDDEFEPDGETDSSQTPNVGQICPTPLSITGGYCGGEDRDTVPFTDITDHWGQEYIEESFKKCIVSGRTPTLFVPDGTATRAEFVRMVLRTYRLGESEYFRLFSDVDPDDWFASDVIQAAKLGLVAGYDDVFGLPTFKPDQPITRVEALSILVKAKCIPLGGDREYFVDVDYKDWFYDVIAFAQKHKIVSGFPVVEDWIMVWYFKPYQFVTRAEALKMVELIEKVQSSL